MTYHLAWIASLHEKDFHTAPQSNYFASEILPNLAEALSVNGGSLSIFNDGNFEPFFGLPTAHYLTIHRANIKFTHYFYQLENKLHCNFVRQLLCIYRGSVIFHELFLTSNPSAALLNYNWEEVLEGFDNKALIKEKFPSPLPKLELSFANKVLTTDGWIAHQMRGATDKEVVYLPTPFSSSLIAPSVLEIRNFKSKVVIFGGTDLEYRPHKIFTALLESKLDLEIVWILRDRQKESAYEICREFFHKPKQVKIIDDWDLTTLTNELKGATLAIALSFSVYSSLEPFISNALAIGVPLVHSDFALGLGFPEKLGIPLLPGPHEVQNLIDIFHHFAKTPRQLTDLESRRNFLARNHPHRVAHELMGFIRERAELDIAAREAWEEYYHGFSLR
jgi:hypothetical protein